MRYARSEVVNADVLHVDGDIVLVGQGIGDLLDARILSDDSLTHFVQGGLDAHMSLDLRSR